MRCVADGTEALPADLALIAVKPQIADAVVGGLSEALGASLVVSIVAGFSCARLESLLPDGTAVVRVMPNTPAMVGEGMAVISGGAEAAPEQVVLVESLFSQIGRAVVVDERYQNAATAISGSGPAYFALVIDALSRAGVRQGLARDVAQALAVQTMLGTARMLEETGVHPEVLIDGRLEPRRHDHRRHRGTRSRRACAPRSPRRSPQTWHARRSWAREWYPDRQCDSCRGQFLRTAHLRLRDHVVVSDAGSRYTTSIK